MRIAIRHLTAYAYEPAIERCALRLRLFPARFASQQVEDWRVSVNGVSVDRMLTTPNGDAIALWTTQAPTPSIDIVAEGVVEVTSAAGVVRGLKEILQPGVYLRSTPLTEADPAIEALAREAGGGAPLDRLHRLSSLVRERIDYVTGSTDETTTAGLALRRGAGVCQDHTHVMISAARSLGFPARYVVGYLMAETADHLFTHAWAEMHVKGLGWVGFDPANRICPTERYVRLASGLDADDAAPVRGSHGGGGKESLATRIDIGQAQQ
jgi:transglutaminase-like putative cysteine protease